MRLQTISNQSFMAGSVSLKRVKKKDIINYGVIENIAKDNYVDLLICKNKGKRTLPNNDSYSVVAGQYEDKFPFVKYGASTVSVDKSAPKKIISNKIYCAVTEAIDKLKETN